MRDSRRRICRRSAALAAVLLATTVAGASGAARTASFATLRGTNFFSVCRFSHAKPDDPIGRPNMPGASHLHVFFGNTTTNASSTLRTLVGQRTTCNRRADTAAYWTPALFRDGRFVRPIRAVAYYQIRSREQVRPFPPGLRMIAGDARARQPQTTKIVFWNCFYPPGPLEPSSSVPRCPPHRVRVLRPARRSGYLQLNVNFPDCWDGRRLDSRDHRTHMRYSSRLRCPRSHPVKVPRIRLTVVYPIRGGRGVALSSGGVHSLHGDFFNAWRQNALKRIVTRCAMEMEACSRDR
jgi:hypothetical protein